MEFRRLMSKFDGVACPDSAALQNDGHDTGFADQDPFGSAVQHSGQQAWLECFDLSARVSQPGDLDDCIAAQAQSRSLAQAQQVNTPGRDVFAHLAGCDGEAEIQYGHQEFLLKEMDLPKVRLIRVPCNPRSVLDGYSEVGIASNTMASDEFNLRHLVLREYVKRLAVDGEDPGVHSVFCPMRQRTPEGSARQKSFIFQG